MKIPLNEQKIFTGIHIEFDTTSPYATKKDMDYIAWALECIAFRVKNEDCCGMISGGTKWWLEKEEE